MREADGFAIDGVNKSQEGYGLGIEGVGFAGSSDGRVS